VREDQQRSFLAWFDAPLDESLLLTTFADLASLVRR
jgi:hypothetical protein